MKGIGITPIRRTKGNEGGRPRGPPKPKIRERRSRDAPPSLSHEFRSCGHIARPGICVGLRSPNPGAAFVSVHNPSAGLRTPRPPGSARACRSSSCSRRGGRAAPAPCGCRSPPPAGAWRTSGAACGSVTGLAMPARARACATARCSTVSCRWWRRSLPVCADRR